MEHVSYTPIGVVRSPFTAVAGMPLQTIAAAEVVGLVEIDPAYADGLADLDGFTHLWLLTQLHERGAASMKITPFLDVQPRGVFATRSPRRPNPIGLSLVRLLRVERATLHIAEIDLLDGTPVLDIKPYVPLFDTRPDAAIGWFATSIAQVFTRRADDRFRS